MIVEITSSQGNPDLDGGQHTNGPETYWIRFRGGPWHPTKYRGSELGLALAIKETMGGYLHHENVRKP